jgi:AraC family transcriptional regulator
MSRDDAVKIRFQNGEPCETLKLDHQSDLLMAEHVVMLRPKRHDFSMHSGKHYIALLDGYRRKDGETYVDGLPRSTIKDYRSKLVFVPASCRLQGWSEPETTPLAFTAAYLDPKICSQLDSGECQLSPMLHFEHPLLAQMMLQLNRILTQPKLYSRVYTDSLAVVLMSEIIHVQAVGSLQRRGKAHQAKGGLAGWQRKAVCDYIEENLHQDVSLTELAAIAKLSPYHFCRAFKETVGEPPHRYQMSRRIEQAKAMLAEPSVSVTDVAATVGYGSLSRFSALFRQVTGHSPRDYRRQII